MQHVLVGLLLLNLGTWLVYRLDKRQACMGGRRVPERTLLLLAGLGGWPGALLGIFAHPQRHKARKFRFLLPLGGIIMLWVLVLVGIWGFIYSFRPFTV